MTLDSLHDALADDLLAELETATHAVRVKRMVEFGSQAREGDSTAATILQGLSERPGFYERLLVLLSCYGSRNAEHVLQSLSDASRILRGLALKLVPEVCTDTQIVTALERVSEKARVVLLRSLIRQRRRTAIETFLNRIPASENEQWNQLLPFRSPESISRLLPDAAPMLGNNDWTRLTRLHPDIAFALLREQTATQTEPDARLLSQVNAVLPELSRRAPDDALMLVRDMLRYESPARLSLQRLAERRINEVVDLLLAHEDGGAANVYWNSFVHRLTPERLLALLQHHPDFLPYPSGWMHRLSPELRRAAYEVAGLGWRTKEGVLDAAVVTLLPGDLREQEGRRHLALPALATRPTQRLPYASFLPWEEAQAVLMPAIRNPDAELRAVALSALIGAARFQRERVADVLAFVRARSNEQDPVRRAMLTALVSLPPSRWNTEHLEEIGKIIQDALNAADLSPATASEAEKWIVSLVPFHPEWAAPWLGKLVTSRGQIHFYRLGDRLNDVDVGRITPALLPVLKAWETRERERFLVQAAVSLGRRLRVFNDLTDILERVAKTTRQNYVAWQVLALLREYRAERFTTLIPEMLREDASVITLQPVYEYLHRKRQDLLTPFLGQQAYSGRFSTGKTRFVLPIRNGFHRWTPFQQEKFAETLSLLAGDGARDTPTLFQAIRQLAALPAVTPPRLMELADANREPLALRDTALRALAHLDAGQGIPVLVEALGDDRARVAIYALRSAILEMPAAQALDLLERVPTEKVTVAKEVVRLLGELDTPDVYPILLEMNGRELHRDIRVALLRALWDHLEREETWDVFYRAAQDTDPAIAAGVIAIPTDRLSLRAQQHLRNLIVTLLRHPDAKVRLDTLERCVSLPLSDTDRVMLPRLLDLLASSLPDESASAARAVFAMYAGNTEQDAVTIGEAIAPIRSNRRALATILAALQSSLIGNRSRLRATVRAVLEALRHDALTVRHRAKLAISGLPWEETAAYLSQLAATNELHAEALMGAVQAIEGSATRANQDASSSLSTLETILANSADERLRRLALAALLAQATGAAGWTGELRARLEIYRSDPSPLVAAAAQFTFPPPEE